MDNKEALKVLSHHQEWRLGNEEEAKYTPKEITKAINVSIKSLSTKTKPTIVDLNTWEGHIVLLCKGWYSNKSNSDIDFFDKLRRIWAIRCGVDEFTGDRVLENVADTMYKILKKCRPDQMDYFHEILHRELAGGFGKPENMSHIQAIVWEYRSRISGLRIKEKVDDKWIKLVRLPKPQKRISNRIIKGNGEFNDYELITNKDK